MSDGAREWLAEAGDAGQRLDRFVARHAGCSVGAAARAIEAGAVRVAGARAPRKGTLLKAGDRVLAEVPAFGLDDRARPPIAEPALALEVLHVDARVVVVSKPAGIPTHPLHGEPGTLASALCARFPECAAASTDAREGGFVHRLDRDTSGALIAARDRAGWEALRGAFRDGAFEKEYLALVAGVVDRAGSIDLPIAHHPGDPSRALAVHGDSAASARTARTDYQPLATRDHCTLVRARLHVGRMHQVRAHFAAIGHPLVGDRLYGGPPALDGAPGHFLHAARVRGPHPEGGTLDVRAPLPPDRAAALARLGIDPRALAPDPEDLDGGTAPPSVVRSPPEPPPVPLDDGEIPRPRRPREREPR